MMKDGMYFSITVIKNGIPYQSDLRELASLSATFAELIADVAFYGQNTVDVKLNELHKKEEA